MRTRAPVRLLAVILANAVLLASPGPFAIQAAAQTIRQTRIPARAQTSGPLQLFKLDVPVGRTNAGVPSTLAPMLPASGLTPAVKAPSTLTTDLAQPDALPLAQIPTLSPDARESSLPGVSALETLQAAQPEQNEDSPLGLWSKLKNLYHGRTRQNLPDDIAPTASEAAEGSVLLPQSQELLEEAALDETRTDKERLSAIAAVARREGPEAINGLRRIASARPEGGAREYEIHRAALKALAGRGVVESLRPVTREHADQILAGIVENRPVAAFFDYDDTLEKHLTPASPELAAALKASADAGVETVILTDRPDAWSKGKTTDDSVAKSLSTLSPEQKAAVTVMSNRGTRLSLSNKKGELLLMEENDLAWTAQESQALLDAAKTLPEKFGQYEYNGKTQDLSKNIFVYFLTPGTEQSRINEASDFMQAELTRLGINYKVTGRKAKSAENPPYLVVARNDKSLGVNTIRSNRRILDQMRDVLRWGLPKSWIPRAWKMFRKFPAQPIAAKDIIVAGDQFFGEHDADVGLVRGAPGALALAVGGTADPRLENIYVWPSQGKAATGEILKALGENAPSTMDKKALVGMFSQRTLSIAAFFLTNIAFPFLAVPVVGWAGYGTLMALGSLAAVATGPLNGVLTDRLSTRNSMLLNNAIRVALSLALPIFASFGMLNFWTLLIAAMASGWLMSSIMITEGAYIKDLAGKKNIGLLNSLTWINFLVIQAVMGVIFGLGSVVDQWNPLVAFYISAGVHAFLAMPIIWLTIPNASRPKLAVSPLLSRSAGFIKRAASGLGGQIRKMIGDWKQVALIAAAVASYAVWSSPLPVAAALLVWIARTDGFKEVWKDKGMRNSMLYLSLAAMLIYPLQYFGFPKMAELLGGAEGKGLILGQLQGVFFFGNMLATAAQARFGQWKVPFLGRVQGERLLQAGVLGLLAAASMTVFFPGSLLAMALTVVGGAGMMALGSKLSPQSWIKILGIGLASIWLPYLVWTVPAFSAIIPVNLALSASLLLIGMFYGPVSVILNSYFQGHANGPDRGKYIGIEGSIFNAAIAIGFALFGLAAGMFAAPFPGALLPWGLAALVAGLLFWRAHVPAPPESESKSPSEKK